MPERTKDRQHGDRKGKKSDRRKARLPYVKPELEKVDESTEGDFWCD